MRLGERGIGLLTVRIQGGKTAASSGRRDRGVRRELLRCHGGHFAGILAGFHRLPFSQIAQIPLISLAATLNPNTAADTGGWHSEHFRRDFHNKTRKMSPYYYYYYYLITDNK